MSAEGQLLVGVVGAGRAFQRLWRPALRLVPGLHSAAIADPADIEAAGIRRYRSLEEMVSSGIPLDGVLVLSPPYLHGRLVGEALAAGHHVLVEKPPVLSPAEVDLWPSGEIGRFAAAFTRRAWPGYLRARRAGCQRWEFELETNPVAWGATTELMLEEDLLPHAVDLAEWVSGSEVCEVRDLRRGQSELSGRFMLVNGSEFGWRVAFSGRYRERLSGDGRTFVRRPGRVAVPRWMKPPDDVAGTREVLRAWARVVASGERSELLGDAETARRHAAVLESVRGPGAR